MNRQISTAFLVLLILSNVATAQNFLVVDQNAWPGKFVSIRGASSSIYWQRGAVNDSLVPKIRSLTPLPDGSIAFVSGLDRSILALRTNGEIELHQGGYLARQVRTDSNGDLYWSGLETPQENNPLPDGFIYRRKASTGQVETLLTFSQELVRRDWWGSFDVRNGQVYVATLKSPSTIYRLENSIPKPIATIASNISSFRLESDNSVVAADGAGGIFRVPDLQQPERIEFVVHREFPIADFLQVN